VLQFAITGLTRLFAPKLTYVKGNTEFSSNPSITSIVLSVLTWTGANFIVHSSTSLAHVQVAQLVRIGGAFRFEDSMVTTLTLTSLTHVGGDFTLKGNSLLATLSIPAFATVTGNVYICNNAALTLPIYLASSVRSTAMCSFTASGSCPALTACPVMA
jgi:hypothetical protein